MTRIDFPDARVGIHSIQQFALYEPDLNEAHRFLTAFGFRVEREPAGLAVRTGNDEHVWARIFEGPRKRLAYVSLGCHAQDFDALRAQIVEAGAKTVQADPRGPAGGLWFEDPDGMVLQVLVADKTMPDSKARMPDLNVPANTRGAPARSAARKVAPTRLSHIALFTSNLTRSLEFYTAALGLRLADRSGEIIAFTYARHGSDHHLLAFVGSHGGGLHHPSWDVPSVEDVGLANTQMRAAGYAQHWGPGRHVLGSNYFNYVKDRFGQWWEFSAHIDYIDKGAHWTVANFADEDSLYLWGPDLPDDFVLNVEPPP